MNTKTTFRTDPLLEGREFFPPLDDKRHAWTRSRLLRLDDGTTMPVLRWLATEKYGTWDETAYRPYWKDRDWTNEVLDNVALVELKSSERRRGRSRYNV